jgi:hypothetical protein
MSTVLHRLGASSPNPVKTKIFFIYIKYMSTDDIFRLWLVSNISFRIKMS